MDLSWEKWRRRQSYGQLGAKKEERTGRDERGHDDTTEPEWSQAVGVTVDISAESVHDYSFPSYLGGQGMRMSPKSREY